jgi:hypothetical protein
MQFSVPGSDVRFTIPDDWWTFCELPIRLPSKFYPYTRKCKEARAVALLEIEPPRRDDGVPPFRKYKLVPVLLGFTSPECAIPPVRVEEIRDSRYRYRVVNGYHRYYASIAVAYSKLPVVVVT